MLVGHEKTIAFLSKIAASYSIPHVILFTGRGVGMDEKKMVAYEFARWLFHAESEASQNFSQFYESECGCSSCRQVSRHIHPDLFVFEHFPMQIQEVRKLKNAFAFTPLVASRKIAIIDNAQTVRNEAANALLKLLEEPKGDALFLLVASSRSDVLATISSRAVEIRFLPRKMTIAERYGNEAILTATRAIKMFEAKTLDQRFGEARNYTVQNKDELIRILDIWLLNLRESLLTNASKHTRELLSKILNAKQCIATTNTNPQLVMEEFLLNN